MTSEEMNCHPVCFIAKLNGDTNTLTVIRYFLKMASSLELSLSLL